MNVYSVVIYYADGSSRGYLISAENQNNLMKKLAGVPGNNLIGTVHIGEILNVEDMML